MKLLKPLTIFLTTLLITHTSFATPNETAQNRVEPTTKSEKIVTQVNINSATVDELVKSLNGIGLSKAKKIVEYREKMGPFVSIEQLKEVSGIGQAILDKNAGKIAL